MLSNIINSIKYPIIKKILNFKNIYIKKKIILNFKNN